MMKFSDFMCFEAAIPELKSTSRDEVIAELVASLEQNGQLRRSSQKQVVSAVIKREREASTGLGKGIAVPHIKHKAVKHVVGAVGLSFSGIDFQSLDKKPVYSVILLLSPAEDPDRHLQAMEKIFNHLQQDRFRKFLRQCRTVDQIASLFHEADDNPELT